MYWYLKNIILETLKERFFLLKISNYYFKEEIQYLIDHLEINKVKNYEEEIFWIPEIILSYHYPFEIL